MLLSALALVLVAALGVAALRALDDPPRDSLGRAGPSPARPPSAAATAPPVLAVAGNTSVVRPDALAAALAPGLADPAFGGRLAGVVLGPDGEPRFARAADTLLPPASTAKLATGLAALSVLGPTARWRTTALVRGGTVVLLGGGDPTLASASALRANPRLASLDALAAATARSLVAAGTRLVSLAYDTRRYSGPSIGPGWKPGYVTAGDVAPVTALMVDGGRVRPDRRARHGDPAAAAARAFAAALAARGVAVSGEPRPAVTASGGAAVVAGVTSPPLPELVERMLTSSDNTIAEALGREIAGRSGLPRSFAGAAEGIRRAVGALGIAPRGLRLVDASGLSPLNRANATTLAALVRTASRRPALHGLFAGLPVAGFSGTLADRFRTGPAARAAGVVRAKTGTLSGVSTLAGIAVDPTGTVLTFAFLAPRATSRFRAQAALDRLAAILASG